MRVRVLIGRGFAALLTTAVVTAFGHDIFARYIQHTAHLTVNPRHLDLELDLTFFEEHSAKERQTMDVNGDGMISFAEKGSYLARLAPTLSRSVTLRVGDRVVALTPLYEPELDLLTHNKTGSGHHRLRLFLFGSTPVQVRSGDTVVIENRLWAEANSFGTLRTEGRDGFELQSESSLDPLTPGGGVKCFRVKCLVAPGKKPSSAASAQPIETRKGAQ